MPEVRRLLAIALPLPVRSPEVRLAWSLFRREARGSGHVTAIIDVVRSADALAFAPKRLHNYGCSTKLPLYFSPIDIEPLPAFSCLFQVLSRQGP